MAVNYLFPGVKLQDHRFGRHEIGGVDCSVYYSEFFAWDGETDEDARMVITIIPHISGKNPKLHYILSRDLSVKSYWNTDIPEYTDNVIRNWVELHSRPLWYNGVQKRKKKELPRVW